MVLIIRSYNIIVLMLNIIKPAFLNKDLWGHRHTQVFMYHLWLLLNYNHEVE